MSTSLREISEKMQLHEEHDDVRFSNLNNEVQEIKGDVKGIKEFADKLDTILFPEKESGLPSPLFLLHKHEKFVQRITGIMWIIGILFTLTVTVLYIHFKI